MSATPTPPVELPLTLRLTEKTRAELTARAAQAGQDLDNYASNLIEQAVAVPLSMKSWHQFEKTLPRAV